MVKNNRNFKACEKDNDTPAKSNRQDERGLQTPYCDKSLFLRREEVLTL